MTYSTAKRLLAKPIDGLALVDLQRHYVRLLDAWRESRAEYGIGQAIKVGFYISVLCEYAQGYTPRDAFLTVNLSTRLDFVFAELNRRRGAQL